MKRKTFVYSGAHVPVSAGDCFILVERCFGNDFSCFTLYVDEGGVPGNLNRDIFRYHGWRGTSYGVSVYAHGLRSILFASEPYYDCHGDLV